MVNQVKLLKILNYINGKLVEPVNGNYLDNYNPSNGQVYSLIPDSEKVDINNASIIIIIPELIKFIELGKKFIKIFCDGI